MGETIDRVELFLAAITEARADERKRSIPIGWKLVPKQLTPEMRMAAKRAMKDYIDKMPEEARARMPRDKWGIVISTNLKFDLRYQAAINAAPNPPNENA